MKNIFFKNILILSIISLLLSGSIFILFNQSYLESKSIISESLTSKFISLNSHVNDKIDKNLFERFGDVQIFSSNQLVKDNIYKKDSLQRIEKYFDKLVTTYKVYDLIALLDSNGLIKITNSINQKFQKIYREPFINKNMSRDIGIVDYLNGRLPNYKTFYSKPFQANLLNTIYSNDDVHQLFINPVNDSYGKIIGFILCYVNLDKVIDPILKQQTKNLKQQGVNNPHFLLLNNQAKIIYAKDKNLINTTFSIDQTIFENFDFVENNSMSIIKEENDDFLIFSKSLGHLSYKGRGWISLLNINKSEALSSLGIISSKFKIYGILSSILVFILTIIIGIFIDIKNLAIRKANQIVSTNKSRVNFLANISHELRTPLNSIIVLSTSLKSDSRSLNDEQLESVDIIEHNGKELLDKINMLLDLSNIEKGNLNLHFEEIRFDDLIVSIKKHNYVAFQEKHLEFFIEIANDLPKSFISDNYRLNQIINNLLNNAIKFTHKGFVKLNFSIGEDHKDINLSNDQILLQVEIIDTGIGIPQEKIDKIFIDFEQVDTNFNKQYTGIGIGLSITQKIVSVLGGKISVRSTFNQGSIFTFVVPIKINPNAQLVQSPPPKNELEIQDIEQLDFSNLLNKNILIVSKNMKELYNLTSTFEENGINVIKTNSFTKAVDYYERIKFDHLILITKYNRHNLNDIKDFKNSLSELNSLICIFENQFYDTKLLNELGVNNILKAPYKLNELIKLLK